jgi:hypothetical protein
MVKILKNISFDKTVVMLLSLFFLYLAIKLRLDFFNASINNLPSNTDEALNILMARDILKGNFPLLFWTQPYQFPLEAYILAIFVNFLPSDAFGARVVLSIISCFSVIGFCFLAYLNGGKKGNWIIYILTLIPSAYLVTRQVGFMVPQYTSTITFGWLLPLLFLLAKKKNDLFWVSCLGFFSGLALSIHLLTLSIVFMVLMAYCLSDSFIKSITNSLKIIPGLFVGLLPYILVLFIPNAYEKVADTIGVNQALGRLINPIFTSIFPATMGISQVAFPDFGHDDRPFSTWLTFLLVFYFLILIVNIYISTTKAIRSLFLKKIPQLDLNDIMTGTVVITLLMAAFAGFGIKYRYILPVVWCFPFLIASIYNLCRFNFLKLVIASVTLFLVYINIFNTKFLITTWSNRHFAYSIPRMPKLDPLIRYLKSNDIHVCYSNWWLVYRIPYETNGTINCTQPYNERFPGWKLSPIKQTVDNARNAPYLFYKDKNSNLSYKNFEKELSLFDISYDKKDIENFLVYGNFKYNGRNNYKLISKNLFYIEEDKAISNINYLSDQNFATIWPDLSQESLLLSTGKQQITVNFNEATNVSLVKLHSPVKRYFHDTRPIKIYALVDNSWIKVFGKKEKLNISDNKIRLHGLRHLVKLVNSTASQEHNHIELLFPFDTIKAKAIRIETPNSSKRKILKISELEFYK